jgi:hypothetical protein
LPTRLPPGQVVSPSKVVSAQAYRPEINIKKQQTAVKTQRGWKLRFTVFSFWKPDGKQKGPDGKLVEVFREEMPPPQRPG